MAIAYFDHNATTPLHEAVLEAMLPYLGQICGNPSSVHRFGRLQRDAIEQARYQVAGLAGAHPDQVVFTSGGTESNNLLIRGFFDSPQTTRTDRLLVSAVEHMSILQTCKALPAGQAERIDRLAVDADGTVTGAVLQSTLSAESRLVSVMTANNETGVIQPVAELAGICRQHGIAFHTDASQAAGKIPLQFQADGINAMTLSAHKFYGPTGVGALILDKVLQLTPQITGGVQEKSLRAGTENVAAIVGMGKAAELAKAKLQARQAHCLALREQLQAALITIPAVTVFAGHALRLPNTVQFGVAGFDGESLLMQLDRKGFAVSSGSACTSGKAEPSHVLQAMQVETSAALAAIRVSFGEQNTASEVEAFVQALGEIIKNNTHSAVMMAASI